MAISSAAVHQRTLSFQATDIPVASGSGSASVASSSADACSQSVSIVEESSSVRKTLTARGLKLVSELDIPMRLTHEFLGKSLCDFWEQYQAGLEAISKQNKMQNKPTEKSVTDIFIGKLQWFNWNRVFVRVK